MRSASHVLYAMVKRGYAHMMLSDIRTCIMQMLVKDSVMLFYDLKRLLTFLGFFVCENVARTTNV